MDISDNAKFAFVIAAGDDYIQDVRNRLDDLSKHLLSSSPPVEGMKKFHDNIWLIPLPDGLPFLADMLKWVRRTGIHLRILFLQKEPDWMQYPADEPKKA